MRLYLNDDMTAAIQWAGTKDDANKLFGRGRWELIDIPTEKPNLLLWLNAQDRDRQIHSSVLGQIEDIKEASRGMEALDSYAAASLALDDAWEALPLPRKLHFAALALEDARELAKRC